MGKRRPFRNCGNCWWFVEYTESFKARCDFDGYCQLSMKPHKCSDVQYCWEAMADLPECDNCGHCTYLGEGDYVCGVGEPVLVIDEWHPTEAYLACEGKSWIEK